MNGTFLVDELLDVFKLTEQMPNAQSIFLVHRSFIAHKSIFSTDPLACSTKPSIKSVINLFLNSKPLSDCKIFGKPKLENKRSRNPFLISSADFVFWGHKTSINSKKKFDLWYSIFSSSWYETFEIYKCIWSVFLQRYVHSWIKFKFINLIFRFTNCTNKFMNI